MMMRRGRSCIFGVVALAALSAGADARAAPIDWSKAETVAVAMTEYRFAPNELHFRRGVAYRLEVENTGAELHELTAPQFLAAVAIGNPEVLAKASREVVVGPGEKKDLYFIADRPGRYPLACADHDWAGMVGEIVVE